MKKYFVGAVILFASTVILYSCRFIKSVHSTTTTTSTGTSICSDYSDKNVNEMEKDHVLNMIRNYYNMQYQAISGNASMSLPSQAPVDSRAVFFNLDTLKKLIYYMEKASAGFSQQDKENMGVNIYFASYPSAAGMSKYGYSYTNRHTLIFVPSIFDNNSHMARDFDLSTSLTGINTFEPQYFTATFLTNPAVTTLNVVGSDYTLNMDAFNFGTTTPPPPTAYNPLLDLTDPN
jgi:hypothetical protein